MKLQRNESIVVCDAIGLRSHPKKTHTNNRNLLAMLFFLCTDSEHELRIDNANNERRWTQVRFNRFVIDFSFHIDPAVASV